MGKENKKLTAFCLSIGKIKAIKQYALDHDMTGTQVVDLATDRLFESEGAKYVELAAAKPQGD